MGFKKGQSGNPKGRRPGTPDRRTDLRELLRPHAPDLITKAVELALTGDTTALKLCLDRCLSPIRPSAEPIQFPVTSDTLTGIGESIIRAAAEGQIPPDQAHQLLQALAAQARIVEIDELERRIRELEQKKDDPPDETYL